LSVYLTIHKARKWKRGALAIIVWSDVGSI
jgi:hypothetical protein